MLILEITLALSLLALPWVLGPAPTLATNSLNGTTPPIAAPSFDLRLKRAGRSVRQRLKTELFKRRARQAEKLARLDPSVVLDLAGAGLKAGSSIPAVLNCLASSCAYPQLVQVSRALLLGVTWPRAWKLAETSAAIGPTNSMHPESASALKHLARFTGRRRRLRSQTSARPTAAVTPDWIKPLQNALEPAWRDGVAPEVLLKGQSRELSNQKEQRAKEAAQKLSVNLVLPLGLCQLPAFILLGIVPNLLGGLQLL